MYYYSVTKIYKMKNSLSVKTILRNDKIKKDGTCPLYYSIILNSKQLRLPVGISLNPKSWDNNSNYPKGNGLGILKQKLLKQEQEIRNYALQLEIADELNLSRLREFYNGIVEKDFYHYFDEVCKKKFLHLKEGTKYHYKLLKKQLQEFAPNLTLSDITHKFCKDFFYYLEVTKEVGESGRATRRKNLIAIFEELIKLEIVSKNPWKAIPKPKEKERDEFLTDKEIQRFKKVNLSYGSKTNTLELTRDLFLFSCYCGLRFSDVLNLKKDSINDNSINIKIRKTGKKMRIPLYHENNGILDKYLDKSNSDFVFPKISNAAVNRNLKIIARKARIDKRVSFHTARHTFGSTLARNGIQPFYIMKLMGHGDVRMTNRYVNTDDKILNSVMQQVSFC